MINDPCEPSFYFLTDKYLANALFKRQMTVFVNNPTNLYSEEYKKGRKGVRKMHAAGRATKSLPK